MIAAIDLGIDISIGQKLNDLAVFQAHDPKIYKRVEAIKQDLRCQMKGTVPAPTRYPLQQWYSTSFVGVPPDIISLQLCTPKVVGT
jgi:hypothetical protein